VGPVQYPLPSAHPNLYRNLHLNPFPLGIWYGRLCRVHCGCPRLTPGFEAEMPRLDRVEGSPKELLVCPLLLILP
jgi:hypothetical protein